MMMYGAVYGAHTGAHFLVAYGRSIWACGWTCWRQLSMSKVLYSLGGAHTFWISMGAFWLNTIDGREGFQFFCTCRCVGPALQRSSSSGCERNLHRRTVFSLEASSSFAIVPWRGLGGTVYLCFSCWPSSPCMELFGLRLGRRLGVSNKDLSLIHI